MRSPQVLVAPSSAARPCLPGAHIERVDRLCKAIAHTRNHNPVDETRMVDARLAMNRKAAA